MNWPLNLFPNDNSKLSIPDLPSLDYNKVQHDLELWGDIARSHLSGNFGKAANMIEATKVFDWLLSKIDEAGDRVLGSARFLHIT